VVGYSFVGGVTYATEWSGDSVIKLGGLPGATLSAASSINDSGQAVGASYVGGVEFATEWSGGSAIKLGSLPGAFGSDVRSINDSGQAVGTTCLTVGPSS
jgi:uncharacterized membrane protein